MAASKDQVSFFLNTRCPGASNGRGCWTGKELSPISEQGVAVVAVSSAQGHNRYGRQRHLSFDGDIILFTVGYVGIRKQVSIMVQEQMQHQDRTHRQHRHHPRNTYLPVIAASCRYNHRVVRFNSDRINLSLIVFIGKWFFSIKVNRVYFNSIAGITN
jgi:hypothetical protein